MLLVIKLAPAPETRARGVSLFGFSLSLSLCNQRRRVSFPASRLTSGAGWNNGEVRVRELGAGLKRGQSLASMVQFHACQFKLNPFADLGKWPPEIAAAPLAVRAGGSFSFVAASALAIAFGLVVVLEILLLLLSFQILQLLLVALVV